MSTREDLLLKMYDQMFNDINRHIMIVWQSVGVVVGAFAILALVEKNIVSLDIATSIILLLCFWLIAHLIDASYWYNRNLVIIGNIERQFLKTDDLKNIHYYFGKHRPTNKAITHLIIQYALGIGLSGLIIFYHFFEQVMPGLFLSICNFDPVKSTPYVITLISAYFLIYLSNNATKKYNEFLKNSPGIEINSDEMIYGVGHGHK